MDYPIKKTYFKKIEVEGEELILHSSGALFIKSLGGLLISDVHLGKVSHFRKHGSAVPLDALLGNFEKLQKVTSIFEPKAIYFLGDLFHSSFNQEWHFFEKWQQELQIQTYLIEGNHDIIDRRHYEDLGVKVFSELYLHNFLLTHSPTETKEMVNLCGHIHPGVLLRGRARQSLRLPCFYRTSRRIVLPAFGQFTGLHILPREEAQEIYVIAKDEVIPL